ncbi:MAG: hypothetical protein IKP07_01935 [Bacilli bacterium]|nr:hypothetical protein [Bacilli bacterium]
MRKIEVPIIILVLAGIIAFVCFFGKDKDEKIEEPEFIGAVGILPTRYFVTAQQGDYYVFTEDHIKFGITNTKDEIVLNNDYYSIEYADEGFFLVQVEDKNGFRKKQIIDLDGNVKLEAFAITIHKNRDRVYYFVKEDKGLNIYDDEFGKYYECEECIEDLGGFIYDRSKIYDVFNKKTYNYNERTDFFGGTLFIGEKGAYSISEDGEFKSYKSASYENNIVTLGDEKYYQSDGIKLNKDGSMPLNKNYSAKFSDSCSISTVNLYKNDKLESDKCYNFMRLNDLVVLGARDDDGVYVDTVYLENGETISGIGDFSIVGDVIVETSKENKYFDLEGNELELKCLDLQKIGTEEYSCQISREEFVLLDKELKPIENEEYNYIQCEDYLCVVGKDDKYGALYNGKKILDLTFPMINIGDNILFVEGITENFIIKLGTENIKYDIVYSEPKTNEIDVDSVIEEFNLYEIEKEIKENEELFKKYAYVVTHSDLVALRDYDVIDYKRRVLMMFKVFVDNKKYLDETYMLKSLKRLHFKIGDTSVSGAAGTYSGGEIVLQPFFADNDHTVYHELMHMVDYSMDERYFSKSIYKCGDETVITKEDRNDCEQQFITSYSGLITEGGAEYYSGLYLNNYQMGSYSYGTNGLASLASIYGDQTINDVFFAPDSELALFELLSKDGMEPDEYTDFLKTFDSLILISGNYNDEDAQKALKYLIDIYKRKKGDKWYEDKEFLLTLGNFENLKLDRNIVGDDIVNNFKLPYDFNKEKAMLEDLGYTYYVPTMSNVARDLEGKTYLSVQTYEYKTKREGYIILEFNPDEEKVIDYKFYPFKEA